MTRRKHPEYTRHLWAAEAKAKGLAVDAYVVVEEMTGWALTAQLDPVVLEAALEARSAMRRVRNLLLPDESFPDDAAPQEPVRRYTREREHPGTGVEMEAIEVRLGEIAELKGDN